jgi:very-long-chain (3R)-3-hydroxyacyl-CoA dehydratase
MNRPSDSQRLSRSASASTPTKANYLTAYNTVSALLWSTVLFRTLSTALTTSPNQVYPAIGTYVRWTQTLAALEVAHSVFGVVRAPLFTTLMQVASRFLLVWGVVYFFPELAVDQKNGGSYAYTGMLLAWSATEVVRYGYFALSLSKGMGGVPAAVKWARYNGFWVLYPLGIGSECYLTYLAATGPAKALSVGGVEASWALWAVLVIYVPGKSRVVGCCSHIYANPGDSGSYILFTHMMAQRRKVMRGDGGKKLR